MSHEETCRSLRPADYVAGEGLSEKGAKLAKELADADTQGTDDPAADNSWGHLTAEALAEDDRQFNRMMHEGKL